jgi:SAM-dependent methyltransferase
MLDPRIAVLPDSELREVQRTSLNRIPDLGDWDAGAPLSDLMREMGESVAIHRKSWEYAVCVLGLRQLGVVSPDARALAVGAGYERPLFYFANCIDRVVATDLYDNPDHEGNPAMLTNPAAFAPFPYREDHLSVLRMSGDDLRFEDQSFDFAFCLSSIEHFGSRDVQRRSVSEIKRVLKRGGVACIITELILTRHSHEEYFSLDEIKGMFTRDAELQLVGGDFDFRISESLVRWPVDIRHSKHLRKSPHVVLRDGDMLWTSLSMFLRKS